MWWSFTQNYGLQILKLIQVSWLQFSAFPIMLPFLRNIVCTLPKSPKPCIFRWSYHLTSHICSLGRDLWVWPKQSTLLFGTELVFVNLGTSLESQTGDSEVVKWKTIWDTSRLIDFLFCFTELMVKYPEMFWGSSSENYQIWELCFDYRLLQIIKISLSFSS